MSEPVPRRGSALLYGVAFAFLVAAVATLAVSVAGFLESTSLLIVSSVLSGVALILAVAVIVAPGRR